MNKAIRAEVCLAHALGDVTHYSQLVGDCVQLARDETFLIKKMREYIRDLPEDIHKQYDFRYLRGNKVKDNKFIPYRFIMRRKLNELIYNRFKTEMNKYIQDAKTILRINLDMDVYSMFIKCQKHRNKIISISNKVVDHSKRKLEQVRKNLKK